MVIVVTYWWWAVRPGSGRFSCLSSRTRVRGTVRWRRARDRDTWRAWRARARRRTARETTSPSPAIRSWSSGTRPRSPAGNARSHPYTGPAWRVHIAYTIPISFQPVSTGLDWTADPVLFSLDDTKQLSKYVTILWQNLGICVHSAYRPLKNGLQYRHSD